MINNQLIKILQLCILGILISGCSAYRNKFSCNPATGANCQSVEEIHAMLQNGKIWELNSNKQKCKGRKCASLPEEDRIASFDGIIKVWIPEEHRMKEYRDGRYWYLPAQE